MANAREPNKNKPFKWESDSLKCTLTLEPPSPADAVEIMTWAGKASINL